MKLLAFRGVHEKGKFSVIDMLKACKDRNDFKRVGAIAVFIGTVRGETPSGQTVKKLELEAYEEKANEVLKEICEELRRREGVFDVQIHHLVGEFNVGEDLVYVLVAGSHRSCVFTILKEAVERYKLEAPIFKKEYVINEKGITEACWVSERKKC